jgi:sulfur relay (sulfurtransferase) DsrC/TusE family protein
MLKVNEKLIEIDSEGYLINPEEWNKEVAIEPCAPASWTLHA